MKILTFTDVHTDKEVLKILDKKVSEADLLICPGDIGWLGHGAEEVIKHFETWNKPLLLIHGNHEFEDEIRQLTKNSKNITFLHKKTKIIDNIMFVGYGGDWYNQVSPEFDEWAFDVKEEIKEKKPEKIVLIVHMPVYETKLDYIHSAHRGNASYRRFVNEVGPNLVFMGHFHETFNMKDIIEKSLLINPGPEGEFYDL